MTLIDLPNGSKWDANKSFLEQESDAMEYYQSVLDDDNMVVDEDEEVGSKGSGKTRWMKRHIDDTDNGLRIIQTRVYVNAKDHAACGAVKAHGGTIEIIT